MNTDKAKERYEDLVKRTQRIEQNRGKTAVPVAVCGTLTIDVTVADRGTDTNTDDNLSDPQLGGTAYFLTKALMSASASDFDVKLLGPRSPLNGEDPKPGWQKMFADCVDSDSNWKDKITDLRCLKDFNVPVSIRVTNDNGSGRELQTGRNKLKWDDYLNLDRLGQENRGLIIVDGIWRFGLYDGLNKVLKKLRELGWVIAIQPGNFRLEDRQEDLFTSVWNAFKYVDILFGTPQAIARFLGTAKSDIANQHVDTIARFIYTKQNRFLDLPPVVVVNDSNLNIEIIVVHERRIITPTSRSKLGVPTGLRLFFVGYFLMAIWRELVKKESGDGATKAIEALLETSLESALKAHPHPSTDALTLKEALHGHNSSSIPREDPLQQRIFGSSKNIREVRARVRELATIEHNVLILGETGVGKDLAAKEIHRLSDRHHKQLVSVNCATLARDSALADSTLFGHVKGAYTGSTGSRDGLVKAAHGGTLFLDEVGDMPEDVQAKLLLAIEEKTFFPLGGDKRDSSDFRLISATNKPKKIRQDLLFRLGNLFTIPPLREQTDDIRPLVREFSAGFVKSGFSFEESALQALERHHWPGNVRELHSLVTFFGAVKRGHVSKGDVEKWIRTQSASSLASQEDDKSPNIRGRAPRADKKDLLSTAVRYLFRQVNHKDLHRYVSILCEYFETPLAEFAPMDFENKGIDNPESALKALREKAVLCTQGQARGAKNVLTDGWRSWFQQLSGPE